MMRRALVLLMLLGIGPAAAQNYVVNGSVYDQAHLPFYGNFPVAAATPQSTSARAALIGSAPFYRQNGLRSPLDQLLRR